MSATVDVVVTWVDDRDESWRIRRDAHLAGSPDDAVEASTAGRYRDWGLLRAWFRGIAAYCPWVRTIHLVTDSPPPGWLVVDHPRLHVVRHEEFIPSRYLPTFNSRTIELNLHRIPGLSERFVYFNDDMFVLRPIPERHFFRRGLPVGFGVMNAISQGDNVSHAMLNDIAALNVRFSKSRVLRGSPRRWFDLRYGRAALQNLALAPWPRFTGLLNHHLPLPLRRSTMERVWTALPAELDRTCRSAFRRFTDLNVFLFSWWALCENRFAPASLRGYGRFVQLADDTVDRACELVTGARVPVVCLNDGPLDFGRARDALSAAFSARLPEPCEFERLPRGGPDA